MFSPPLPSDPREFVTWSWAQFAPYYDDLQQRPLSPQTVADWLADWTAVSRIVLDSTSRLRLAHNLDTADEMAEQQYFAFLEDVLPFSQAAEQKLKEMLLASGLSVEGMELPIHRLQVDVDIFAAENLALFAEEKKIASRYDKLVGAQTVEWDGEERTLTALRLLQKTPDRAVREQIWRSSSSRQLADRAAINEVWQDVLALRLQIARNAGFDDYRSYRWQFLHRFDYTPDDCRTFHDAIEQVVVPVASRVYERSRQRLGVDRLRPWDVVNDTYQLSFSAVPPFADVTDLMDKARTIFQQVDPKLGDYFATMQAENLLDLPNRKGKAPGAYCTSFPVAQRPFIFMNAVGSADDIRTMLHEAGHAFHVFEASYLPYVQQAHPGAEFAEVASMSMELLASPYLMADYGGYFDDPTEVARFRISHLEKTILFWPYMAVVDAFQHWVYENPEAALIAANCDAAWSDLWQRFIPAIDWSGFEDEMATGWHRKLHIFRYPFYYVEYGLAQLGAIQVWRNSLTDRAQAVAQYRQALSLGGQRPLPELFATAGAKFAFDATVMNEAVTLLENTIDQLRSELA